MALLLASLLLACGENSPADSAESAASQAPQKVEEEKEQRKNILFFGNSLTAAYGLDPSDGYVSLIQQRLDSMGLPYKAINAGLSGETTAGGKERIGWVLRQKVDVFLLELGGNDALRGIPPTASMDNLSAIIEAVQAKNPAAKIILAGMEAPPNMGDAYTSAFRKIYPSLAKKYETALIPFFLDGVAGIQSLNQNDRIHPNEEGQFILVENVWKVLKELL